MKHEVINKPSTQNVLRMMFECKTFDEKNEEKSINQFETLVNISKQSSEISYSTNDFIRAIPV
tara:strand:+ start:248 stop:436 length:189 start_codon:yes stop_codon:yes gene_type:complete